MDQRTVVEAIPPGVWLPAHQVAAVCGSEVDVCRVACLRAYRNGYLRRQKEFTRYVPGVGLAAEYVYTVSGVGLRKIAFWRAGAGPPPGWGWSS